MKLSVMLLQTLRSWLENIDMEGDEKYNAITLQWVILFSLAGCFLSSLIYAFLLVRPATVITLWTATGILLIILWLIRKSYLSVASLFYLLTMSGIITYELVRANGMRSIGATLYPAMVIFASMILTRRPYFFYLGVILCSVGFILYGQSQGWIGEANIESPSFGVFLVYSVIILGTSWVARVMMSGRKEAFERLRHNQQMLEAQQFMLEHVGQAVVGCQAENTIIYWNRAASTMYGWEAEEVIGRKYHDVIQVETQPENMDVIRVSLRQGTGWAGELTVIRRDQRRIPILGSITPILDEKGEMTNWIGVGADLTERKQAEEKIHQLNAELEQRVNMRTAELEAANRELQDFTYTIAHDLRAPARAMIGFSRMLQEEHSKQLTSEGLHYLSRMNDGARRMGKMIDDFLTFVHLGRQTLRKSPLNMQILVAKILEEFEPMELTRRMKIEVGSLSDAVADQEMLEQVWWHLVNNAFKFTRKVSHATIEIGSVQKDGILQYFIRDNGIGFDMQYANKIFGVFNRLNLEEDYEGTGMGLAIVHRIITRHGGQIWAEAEVDKGATFYFTLASDHRTSA